MKRKWENHELIEHWTLEDEEQQLIGKKRGVNRLGFALLLKFFQLKGRFPEKQYEIPRAVRSFVSEQLGLQEERYQQYNWQGRVIKRHRVEIRQLYSFHRMSTHEFDNLRQWLVDEVIPQAVNGRRVNTLLYGQLRTQQIEPPTYKQVERLVNSAHRQFEVQLCDSIMEQLPNRCRRVLGSVAKR